MSLLVIAIFTTGTGSSKMADQASKFLLLYIKNELSIYIYIYIYISGWGHFFMVLHDFSSPKCAWGI